MPLIPSKLNFLPDFEGRRTLYSQIIRKDSDQIFIRILTIWPNNDRSAPVEASLSIEDLLEGPYYNAISYYWGNPNDLESVIVHGSDAASPHHSFEAPVTKNLTKALRQFRARAYIEKKPLRLWTDALCINQCNAFERHVQVGIIEQIFAYASSVWIWLGESDDLVEEGLAAFISQAHLYDTCDTCASEETPQQSVFGVLSTELTLSDEISFIKQALAIEALPYWSRGWMFQEAACNIKYLCYGESKIWLHKWLPLLRLFLKWQHRLQIKLKDDAFLFALQENLGPEWITRLNLLIYALNPFEHAELDPDQQLLSKDRFAFDMNVMFYRTSDPKDSVFVLRQLVPALAAMQPYYTRSIETIFSEATELILCDNGLGLRNLQHWTHPHASSHLPSWAFDFTRCSDEFDENGDKSFLHTRMIRQCDASAGSYIRVKRRDDKTISAAGFIFDEIESIISSTDRHSWNSRVPMSHVISCLRKFREYLNRYEKPFEECNTQIYLFLRTISIGWKDPFFSPLEAVLLLDGTDSKNVSRVVFEVLEGKGFERREGISDRRSTLWQSAFGTAQLSMAHVTHNTSRAQFIVTKNHRFGLAHARAAVGDRIAILSSGNTPYTLRPVPVEYAGEEAYRIIAGGYIDGKFQATCGLW